MLQPTPVEIGLAIVFVAVLSGPFLSKRIEENLEAFLFAMGVVALTITGGWKVRLVEEALTEPIVKGIVPAVLIAGLVFHYNRERADRLMNGLLGRVPLAATVFVFVVALGLISSIITAIIAALFLVELVNNLPMDRKAIVRVTILACFSIGFGAALTPLGEPLATIAIAKLEGEPYRAGFGFLANLLGVYIVVGVVAMGLLSVWFTRHAAKEKHIAPVEVEEHVREAFIRAVKVYAFVTALVLLGEGFKPIIDKYFAQVPAALLFWLNLVSAVLDNATLTAAEIAPSLHLDQIRAALIGLLISGGMLIPGNIPNIIAAQRLRISAREWARLGVPLGLVTMVAYFVWLFLIPQ